MSFEDKLRGFTFDDEGYQKAQKERWSDTEVKGIMICSKHDTSFAPHHEAGEPCWGCHDEFNKEITRNAR